jgi:uncharacterized protein YwbE
MMLGSCREVVTLVDYDLHTSLREQIEPMGKKTDKQTEKLEKLVAVMSCLMGNEFTGHIKINFTQGSIGRVEKFEEILKVAAN